MTVKDMLGRTGVVSREDALKTLEEHFTTPLPLPETVPLDQTLGRIIADEVRSP